MPDLAAWITPSLPILFIIAWSSLLGRILHCELWLWTGASIVVAISVIHRHRDVSSSPRKWTALDLSAASR
jgi:hypothetical protein